MRQHTVSTADERILHQLGGRQRSTLTANNSRISRRAFGARRGWAKRVVVLALLLGVTGCSLISLKSPEKPLSTRDLNARILTREYSAHFIAAVERRADDITLTEKDPHVVANALRWEIAVATQSVRAATQVAPMMSVIDTWALALQMKAFMGDGGTGSDLFGSHQPEVLALAEEQAANANELARRLVDPKDFPRYQKFVQYYVIAHPLEDLKFSRAPIVELWSRESRAEVKLIDSLGTIPEAMSDFADRLQIYGDALPAQTLWKTELALRESGYSTSDIRSELDQLDRRLDRMAVAAESAPELVHDAISQVRSTLVTIIDRLNSSSASMVLALRDERIALTADVRLERLAALLALDEQRKAFAIDAAGISDQVVTTAGREIRRLAREVMLLLTLLAVIVLGVPFAAGYFLGRGRRGQSR